MVPNDNEKKFAEQETPEDPWESNPPPPVTIEKGDNPEDIETRRSTEEQE